MVYKFVKLIFRTFMEGFTQRKFETEKWTECRSVDECNTLIKGNTIPGLKMKIVSQAHF